MLKQKLMSSGLDNKLLYNNEKTYQMHQEIIQKVQNFTLEILLEILDPDFSKNRSEVLDKMQDQVEDIVMWYNIKKMHKLVFYLIIRAQSNVLIELKEFDRALKALKSLKNYCKRWQRYGETHLLFRANKFKDIRGTNDFNQLLMSVYHQIGLIYREIGYNLAAMDYFKK